MSRYGGRIPIVSRLHEVANALGMLLVFALVTPAHAQGEFYKGKTITIILGDPPGGGADTYARLFARNLPRFISGAPSVVVQNMPGASSILAANFVYKTAPRDGTVILMPQAAAVFARLFGNPSAAYQPDEFQWIGNLDQATGTCSAWKGSGLKAFDDLLAKTTLLAASAPSGVASEYPRAFNALYGTRIRVIHGYVGTSNIVVAMQNGEVQGSCAFMVSALRSAFKTYFDSGQLTPIIQTARRDPTLVGVPHILDFARNEEERAVMRLVTDRDIMARTLAFAPGVPRDRLMMLRGAFEAIMKDPDFIESAARANLPISPSSAVDIDALVKTMTGASPSVIARARATLESGKIESNELSSLSGSVTMTSAGSLEIADRDGARHAVKFAPGRTVLMIGGTQAEPGALQPGMACLLRYSSDKIAEVVTCK